MATQKARFLLRSGTAAEWTTVNPILAAGEPGYETDTKTFRVGDGLTAFTSLPGFALATGVPPNARQIATDNAAGTDGGGDLSANRTIRLTGQALLLHQLADAGILVRAGNGTIFARTLTGTPNQVQIAQGAGGGGNPTFSLIFPDQPTAEAGTDAVSPTNSLRVAQQIAARAAARQYVSSVTPIALNGLYTFNHGLGAQPDLVIASFICTTAINGYVVGEEVRFLHGTQSVNGDWTPGLVTSSTQVRVRTGPDGLMFAIGMNGATRQAYLPANFGNMIVRAYRW